MLACRCVCRTHKMMLACRCVCRTHKIRMCLSSSQDNKIRMCLLSSSQDVDVSVVEFTRCRCVCCRVHKMSMCLSNSQDNYAHQTKILEDRTNISERVFRRRCAICILSRHDFALPNEDLEGRTNLSSAVVAPASQRLVRH
jgi:hypothetical protein